MPAIHWIDNDADYERWLLAHPDGFMANLNNPPAGKYFLIHRAKHNLPDRSMPGSFNPRTGNRYSKVTAERISELIAWAKENLPALKEIGNTNYCKICTPTDDSPTVDFGEDDLGAARIGARGRVPRPVGVLKPTVAQGTTKVFSDEIIRPSANSPFPFYTGQQIDFILGAYRRLFPNPKNPALRKHLDLDRYRPWSLLTTDFHQVNSSIIEEYHKEREQVRLEGLPYEEAGQVLQKLCRKYPSISGSLGISPWTDEILLYTFKPNIQQVWAIVGHDWYSIIPKSALKGNRIRSGSSFLIESRSPLRRYPIYTKNPYYRKWADYRSSLLIPPSNTCLLFLNLVPDLRPPGVETEHTFPFGNSGLLDYGECVEGTINLLSSLPTDIELSRILCWGGKVRDAISRYSRINPHLRFKDPIRLPIGKYNPRVLASYHPGAADKYFPEGRKKYYDHCWLILQSKG
jgi:hypothetical protein